jgi:hypothetical protein
LVEFEAKEVVAPAAFAMVFPAFVAAVAAVALFVVAVALSIVVVALFVVAGTAFIAALTALATDRPALAPGFRGTRDRRHEIPRSRRDVRDLLPCATENRPHGRRHQAFASSLSLAIRTSAGGCES